MHAFLIQVPSLDRDVLLFGSQTNLLAYDIEQNTDLFYKEVSHHTAAYTCSWNWRFHPFFPSALSLYTRIFPHNYLPSLSLSHAYTCAHARMHVCAVCMCVRAHTHTHTFTHSLAHSLFLPPSLSPSLHAELPDGANSIVLGM